MPGLLVELVQGAAVEAVGEPVGMAQGEGGADLVVAAFRGFGGSTGSSGESHIRSRRFALSTYSIVLSKYFSFSYSFTLLLFLKRSLRGPLGRPLGRVSEGSCDFVVITEP